jgi:hypothetical protein
MGLAKAGISSSDQAPSRRALQWAFPINLDINIQINLYEGRDGSSIG